MCTGTLFSLQPCLFKFYKHWKIAFLFIPIRQCSDKCISQSSFPCNAVSDQNNKNPALGKAQEKPSENIEIEKRN